MKLTRKTLVEIAEKCGLQVTKGEIKTAIHRGSIIIHVYDNGDILRGDVQADLVTKMSVNEASRLLKLY